MKHGENKVTQAITDSLKGIASAAAEGAITRASKEIEGHVEDLSARGVAAAEKLRSFFAGQTREGKRARADVDVRVVPDEPRRR